MVRPILIIFQKNKKHLRLWQRRYHHRMLNRAPVIDGCDPSGNPTKLLGLGHPPAQE